MKKMISLLVTLLFLTACTAQPPAEPTPPSSTPEPSVSEVTPTESWKLLDENYMPIYEDPCETTEFPDYEGMSREDFEAKAAEAGYNSDIGPFAAWATSGKYSPGGRYLAYHSNKDCLDSPSKEGFSIFLLDTETGEDRALLSGSDGNYYIVSGWLDEETLLCLEVSRETVYVACDVGGCVSQLQGISDLFAQKGRYLVTDQEQVLQLYRIEADGSVTALAQTRFDGDQLMHCGLSPDGKWVCSIEQSDVGVDEPYYTREVVLWNTEDGTRQILTPPAMTQGEDAAAISAQWQDNGFAIYFNVSDAPDENGHNELWHYQNALFFH